MGCGHEHSSASGTCRYADRLWKRRCVQPASRFGPEARRHWHYPARCDPLHREPSASNPIPPGGRKDYANFQIHLAVVDSAVEPSVSARKAFSKAGHHPDAHTCGIRQVLAYWSSGTPADIPTHCVPPSACAHESAKPLFQHVLAWVFTWRTDCPPATGPLPLGGGSPRPEATFPPLACGAITFVDANTGSRSEYTDVGGL
jgi:hypothetical protein